MTFFVAFSYIRNKLVVRRDMVVLRTIALCGKTRKYDLEVL